jgi:uncharacterized membrane protein
MKTRIVSVDVVRGIVMVVMALDHVRDYFHITANTNNPLDLDTTTSALFFTRWITHFCAPVFVFLSGTSIYLQGLQRTKKELAIFIMKRGLWLIVAEFTLVAFAWTFNPHFNFLPMQVIWTIGMSMLIIGLLLYLNCSFRVILTLGLVLVAAHNLLDRYETHPGFMSNFWWDLLHSGKFSPYELIPGHFVVIVYPFPPWTGLMMVGYCAGLLFTPEFDISRRKRILIRSGLFLILLFVVLRFTNVYGDPIQWTKRETFFRTFLSFINVQKYPPSLLYLSVTIGPAMILLALTEKIRNGFSGFICIFGRTAFFYYVLHIYLIHFLAAVFFFARGHTFEEASKVGTQFPFRFVVPGEGYGLAMVYVIWLAVVLTLYPVCKRYDRYKRNHREKWWLSYI